MRFTQTILLASTLGTLALLSDPAPVRAEVKACGGVFLSGDAKCEWREKEQCKTECTTATVETACVAKIYVNCESGCTASASTTCEAGCTETCTTTCDSQAATDTGPGCSELCGNDCKTSCTDSETGQVQGCCMHNCQAHCGKRCHDAPDVMEPAQCPETCTTACGGSCTAQANVECQVNCQSNVYEECQTELVTTCETKCEDDGGAIFCDGQFVNAANANDCAAELKATFNFDINVHAAVEAVGEVTQDGVDATKDGAKTTKSKAKNLCSIDAAGLGGGAGGSALFLLGLGLVTRVRRAKRSGASKSQG